MSILKIKKNGEWVESVGLISDADTLDGRHASAFALANHTHEFADIDLTTAELITVEDIDAICGEVIQMANAKDVTF